MQTWNPPVESSSTGFRPTTVYEGAAAPRLMYYGTNGERYTPEQFELHKLMTRLEKKIDALMKALGKLDS
jgi:hypothetical protein